MWIATASLITYCMEKGSVDGINIFNYILHGERKCGERLQGVHSLQLFLWILSALINNPQWLAGLRTPTNSLWILHRGLPDEGVF